MPPQDALAFATELEAIKAESIGWLPLDRGVYFHLGEAKTPHETVVIQVVGMPDASLAGMNVLLLS
jgi:hypothetical protein